MSENKSEVEISREAIMNKVETAITEVKKLGEKISAQGQQGPIHEIHCPDGDCQLKYNTEQELIEHWNRRHNHPVKHVLECTDCGEELKRNGYTKATVTDKSKATTPTGTADAEWSPYADEPEEPVNLPND